MTNEDLEQFFDLLDKIVNEKGAWKTKRDALHVAASNRDRNNIQEFAGWWEETGEEEEVDPEEDA